MRIDALPDAFPLKEVFAISRESRTEARVVTALAVDGDAAGRGECVPYARYGETIESTAAQIGALNVENRTELQTALPPGAARNAVDCAFWDLDAKRAGQRVWKIAGLPEPKPVTTAFTLSLDAPERMRQAAARHAHRPLLKIKLGGEEDMARLEAVRAGAPDAQIIVDANEGWSPEIYSGLAPHLARLGVQMVEQPLPACADESCHDRSSLPALRGKYDMINIKLDKTGGLTEALALKAEAERQGYGIMVGCMVGSSLAMAPALLLAQGAAVVDLDGPLLLAEDRDAPLTYDKEGVHPPRQELWG